MVADLPVVPLPIILPASGETVAPFAFRHGGSLPTDLALLRALAHQKPGCRYFEIGTWRGESVASMAAGAAEVHTLNLAADELRTLGMPERYIELHSYFSRPLPNVTHLHGNSATYNLAALGHYDLVFIDGDHRYEAVRTDTRRVFEHLMGPKTVVVWYDASRTGKYWPASSTGCPQLRRVSSPRLATRSAPCIRLCRCPPGPQSAAGF